MGRQDLDLFREDEIVLLLLSMKVIIIYKVLAALGAVGDLSPFAIPANEISLGLTRIASTLKMIDFGTVLTD